MTPAQLGLWLAADINEHVTAMTDLVESNFLVIMSDMDTFTVTRAHDNSVSRYEIGRAPILPNCSA